MKDLTLKCPYCNQFSELIDSAELYGKSYGMMYICRPCDAYVGCHNDTIKPLGTMADFVTREARKDAHIYFDKLWKKEYMTRSEAYAWLQEQFILPKEKCHIGCFDKEHCMVVIELSDRKLRNLIQESIK